MSSATVPEQLQLALNHPAVSIQPVRADVCGALGCVVDELLVRVEIDGYGRRVLCPDHAAGLVNREVER